MLPPLLDVVPEARLNLAIHQAFSAHNTAAALALVQPLVAPIDLEEWLVKGAVLVAHANTVMQQTGGDANPLIQARTALASSSTLAHKNTPPTHTPKKRAEKHEVFRGVEHHCRLSPQEWLATASECLRVFGASQRECDTVQGVETAGYCCSGLCTHTQTVF